MQRYLSWLWGLAAAFSLGFVLITALPNIGPSGPGGRMTIGPEEDARSSTHYKQRVSILFKNRRPERTASAPPQTAPGSTSALEPDGSVERGGISGHSRWPPVMPRPLTRLVAFETAPFPYDGKMPRTRAPFLNFEKNGRPAHKTRSGRIYWADETYSDSRTLLHIPKGFDIQRPGVIVMFLHGHGATLARDVSRRQRLPAQISESGINAVLVAPQFALDARDSSAGKFWEPAGARRFLDEATVKLTQMHGAPEARRAFANMPVIIIAYSGGYLPAAWALAQGGIGKRVIGVVLLDALYGELSKFESWVARHRSAVFMSVYTHLTRARNETLKRKLAERGIRFETTIPARLRPGSVIFSEVEKEHRDYVTDAWTKNPISDLLTRLEGTVPRAPDTQSASLEPGIGR